MLYSCCISARKENNPCPRFAWSVMGSKMGRKKWSLHIHQAESNPVLGACPGVSFQDFCSTDHTAVPLTSLHTHEKHFWDLFIPFRHIRALRKPFQAGIRHQVPGCRRHGSLNRPVPSPAEAPGHPGPDPHPRGAAGGGQTGNTEGPCRRAGQAPKPGRRPPGRPPPSPQAGPCLPAAARSRPAPPRVTYPPPGAPRGTAPRITRPPQGRIAPAPKIPPPRENGWARRPSP